MSMTLIVRIENRLPYMVSPVVHVLGTSVIVSTLGEVSEVVIVPTPRISSHLIAGCSVDISSSY